MKHRNKKEKVAISIITRTERSKKNNPREERGGGRKKKKREKAERTRATEFAAMKKGRGGWGLTVVFTVTPYAQAPGLDSRKTKSNGFAQSGGIDVGYSILVANPSVREIQPLPWDIAIGVGGVVRRKPTNTSTTTRQKEGGISMSRRKREEKKKRTLTIAEGPRDDAPSLNKNLFCPVRCTGGGSSPNVRC